MSSIVCTLFEGHYHYGVAGLINSLSKQGFKGSIYAGYRGELPKWAKEKVERTDLLGWLKSYVLRLDEIDVFFLQLNTPFHLANYKPFFLLEIQKIVPRSFKGFFYFDPDIVIKINWFFFEEWVSFGVALVHEITANDMPITHPIRLKWTRIIDNAALQVQHEITSYINSGFCGVSKESMSFIKLWADIIEIAIERYNLVPTRFAHAQNRVNPFYAHDQDALNIAAMCYPASISEMGPEAMGLINGGWTMAHAIGSPKPWNKNFLVSFLKGAPPSLADKEYWVMANWTIKPFSNLFVMYKLLVIKASSFFGRFYRKY